MFIFAVQQSVQSPFLLHFHMPWPSPGSSPDIFLGQTLWGFPLPSPFPDYCSWSFHNHSSLPINIYLITCRSFQQTWKLSNGSSLYPQALDSVWPTDNRQIILVYWMNKWGRKNWRRKEELKKKGRIEGRIKWMVHAFQAYEKGPISRTSLSPKNTHLGTQPSDENEAWKATMEMMQTKPEIAARDGMQLWPAPYEMILHFPTLHFRKQFPFQQVVVNSCIQSKTSEGTVKSCEE